MDTTGLQADNMLAYFTQGEPALAMYCVDMLQIHSKEGGMSTLDCGRILMELAYKMAQCDFNNAAIEPILHSAAAITADTLTGNLEVHIVACRIRLLKGDPFGARKVLEKMLEFLPEGLALATIDGLLACHFASCVVAIRRATEQIYRNHGVAQVQ